MQDLQDRVITCPECLADNHFVGTNQAPGETIRCSNCGASVGTWADTRDAHVAHEPLGKDRPWERIDRADRPQAPALTPKPATLDRAEEIRVNNGLHNGERYLNR